MTTEQVSAVNDAAPVPTKIETTVEPLLPVEKKLIAWSLGLGIVLLVLLTFLTRR